MGFKDDLATGKNYEDEVVELFQVLFDNKKFRKVTKEDDPDLYRHLDIIEVPPSRKKKHLTELITVECKYSGPQHDDSPNVVVEFTTYDDKPSGITTSCALYWVFKTGKYHLICKKDEIIKAIIFDLSHKDSHKKIKVKHYDKKGLLLVPITLLKDPVLCPSTQQQLTKSAYLGEET